MTEAKGRTRKNIFTLERILKGELHHFFAIVLLRAGQSLVYLCSVYYLTRLIEGLEKGNTDQIYFTIFMFFAFRLMMLVAGCVVRRWNKKYYCNIAYRLKSLFYERISSISPSKLHSYIHGDLVTRFTGDLNDILRFSGYKKGEIISNIFSLILVAGYIITFDGRLILIAFTFTLVLWIAIKSLGKKLEIETEKLQQQTSILNTAMEDVFDHLLEIKAFEAEEFIQQKSMKEIEGAQRQNMKVYLYERLIWAAEIIFQESFMMGYFIMGGLLAYFGRIDFSSVVGLIFVTGFAVDLLFQIPYLLSSVFDISPKIQRYLDFIKGENATVKPLDESHFQEEGEEETVIIHQLNYKYKDKKVLNNLSLTVKRGEKVAIIGKSGGGKSTLLRLISGYDTQYEGNLKVLGREIREYPIEEIAKKISYYPQESFLFHKTIMENFLLFSQLSENALKEKMKEAEKSVYIEKDLEAFPAGYETLVDLKKENISKGQLQKLCLMICLMKEHELLMIDEGFSAIDPETTEKIIRQILSDDSKTIIMVMHQISNGILKLFDSVYSMDEGRLVEINKIKETAGTGEGGYDDDSSLI